MNNINVIGRIVRDIDLKFLSSGKALAKFTVAVDSFNDYTNFFNVQVWGDQAENAAKYVGKGNKVGITGELRQNRWEDDSGNKRDNVVINARNIDYLEFRDKKQDSKKNTIEKTEDKMMKAAEEDDFDVPF